jgi:hypothetical protein
VVKYVRVTNFFIYFLAKLEGIVDEHRPRLSPQFHIDSTKKNISTTKVIERTYKSFARNFKVEIFVILLITYLHVELGQRQLAEE